LQKADRGANLMSLPQRLRFRKTSLLFFLGVCSIAGAVDQLEIPLKNEAGVQIGTAKLKQLKQGLKIELEVKGLKPGEHAFHIHEKGSCNPPDFASAGEHFSPQGRKHGYDTTHGPHEGDMPNLIVGTDGAARVEVINTHVSLSSGATSLLKKGGTSLVIHARPDDYQSQPAGEAGARIACGEIRSDD